MRQLTDAINEKLQRSHLEVSLAEVRKAVDEAIERGWCEWKRVLVESSRGTARVKLERTEHGTAAYSGTALAANCQSREVAERIILGLLLRVKNEWKSRLRGDPRVRQGRIFFSSDDKENAPAFYLQGWAAHLGVNSALFEEAYLNIRGRGWAVPDATMTIGGHWVTITPDGERQLESKPMTDGQKAVWDMLAGRVISAPAIAKELDPSSDVAIRQLIKSLRRDGYDIPHKTGRGYYRPDAPPPA